MYVTGLSFIKCIWEPVCICIMYRVAQKFSPPKQLVIISCEQQKTKNWFYAYFSWV